MYLARQHIPSSDMFVIPVHSNMTDIITYDVVRISSQEIYPYFHIIEKRENVRYGEFLIIETALYAEITKKVIPVSMMIRLNDKFVYDCWINYYNQEGRGKLIVDALIEGKYILLGITQRKKKRQGVSFMKLKNEYGKIFKRLKEVVSSYKPWNEEDFLLGKNNIIYGYTKDSFWNRIYSYNKRM